MNTGFEAIIGHEEVVRHLLTAIENDRVSHAYLFTGEKGSGKKMMADAFAMALECRDRSGPEPCLMCPSCRKAADHNHPDILYVTHEKPNLISVDEVRAQLVGTAEIRPYESRWKVYIVDEAEKMNPAAQNAILKTIEEPPSYVVILLLSENPDILLPTIRSRVVTLPLLPVSDSKVEDFLKEEEHVPDYEARILAAFARGNIGRAHLAASDDEFSKRKEKTLALIRNIHEMDTAGLKEAVRLMKEDEEHIGEVMDLIRMWFRDVLYFKAAADIDQLVFSGEIGTIRAQAKASSYGDLQEIISAADRTEDRLRANVNFELAMELLLFEMREHCRA